MLKTTRCMNQTPFKQRSERRTTTRQVDVATSLVKTMKPDQTLVFYFDGVNLRELVAGKKIRPGTVKAHSGS